jgi:hypothetical protein
VESQRYDTSIPFPKPPLPNIRGSINCTTKIHGPKLKFLKTKEIRQNTKIMGTNQNHGEEGKFSPRHKYNVEYRGVLLPKYSRLMNEGSKVGVEWGKGFHYILH